MIEIDIEGFDRDTARNVYRLKAIIMLGFSPFASVAFDALPGIIISRTKIPVELISTIRTVIEQIDMPIEILEVKKDGEVLKWVLTSRGNRWVLSDTKNRWVLDSKLSKWVVK